MGKDFKAERHTPIQTKTDKVQGKYVQRSANNPTIFPAANEIVHMLQRKHCNFVTFVHSKRIQHTEH